MKIIVLNPFTLDLDAHSNAHGHSNNEPSLTVQADKEQSDINTIVRQFGITQQLPYGVSVPSYDDFSDAPTDFHQAMNFIRSSNDLFMDYPADVRSRFDNDAGKFLDFIKNPANRDEAIKLGFIDGIQAQPAQPVQAGNGLPDSAVISADSGA